MTIKDTLIMPSYAMLNGACTSARNGLQSGQLNAMTRRLAGQQSKFSQISSSYQAASRKGRGMQAIGHNQL